MSRTLYKLKARLVATITKPGWHGDGGGLYLRIGKDGSKKWVFVAVRDKRRREMGLGSATSVSLAAARDLAAAARQSLAAGIDPIDARNSQQGDAAAAAAIEAAVPTFGEYTETILPDILPGFKNEMHRITYANSLRVHAAPLAKIPINQVSTDDVLAVLRPIWLKIPETARRVRGRIARVLGAAKAAGLRPLNEINPATWDDHLEHFLSKKRVTGDHHAAMPWRDMPEFMACLRESKAAAARPLEFLILTWTRTNEAIGARMAEVDFAAGTWTIPASRMKMGGEHVVPLCPRALEIAKEACVQIKKPNDLLFRGGKGGGGLSNMAMLMLVRRMTGKKLTVHGFRSTARDWSGEATDFPRELAEMALAHAVGNQIEQAYRREKAIEKRRALMVAWERYLASTPVKAPEPSAIAVFPRVKKVRVDEDRASGQTSIF